MAPGGGGVTVTHPGEWQGWSQGHWACPSPGPALGEGHHGTQLCRTCQVNSLHLWCQQVRVMGDPAQWLPIPTRRL